MKLSNPDHFVGYRARQLANLEAGEKSPDHLFLLSVTGSRQHLDKRDDTDQTILEL